MRILITRPRKDADALAETLKARGHEVIVEPMLEIRPVADAKVDLQGVQAVLFTSANGVRAFAVVEQRRDLPALCVGDTTAATAREAGFGDVASAAGNVEDLARLVRERLKPGDGALLHAAGANIAGDLAGALGQDGFEVRRVVLYAAEPVASLSPVTAAALKARQIDLAVFYSPRSAEAFARLVREAGLASALSRTVALGLSPAVVQAVAGLPWAMTESARRPQEADLIQAIARHKIIAQLAGTPVEEETPEVVFGRRAEDTAAGARNAAAAAEAERRAPPPAAAPTSGGPSRLVSVAAWLAVLLSLGTLTLVLLQGERPSGTPAPAAILRLETRLAALERQIAALPSEASAASSEIAGRLKALEDRLAALESRPASPPSRAVPDPALLGRIETLEKSLAERAGAPPPTPAVPEEFAARVTALERALEARPDIGQIASALAENRRMTGEVARLQEQVATLGALTSRGGGRDGLLLAVGQLREAARQGRSFSAELATVQALAVDEQAVLQPLAQLQPLAARSVPTRENLRGQFPAVAAQAARAEQMAALAAEEPADSMVGELWNGVVRRLSSLVSVRRVGEVGGETTAARLARADAAVAAGDLAAALGALEGLAGPAAEAVAAWQADARARVELDRAGEALLAAALAATGAPAGQ